MPEIKFSSGLNYGRILWKLAFVLLTAPFPRYVGQSLTVLQWEQVGCFILFRADFSCGEVGLRCEPAFPVLWSGYEMQSLELAGYQQHV